MLDGSENASTSKDPRTARNRRVLVVEDNRLLAELSQGILEEEFGYTVAVAYDGSSGLALAASFQPHAVLCDLSLAGGIDGYAVARAIRAAGPPWPLLIATTAHAEADVAHAVAAAGFDLQLTKPVDFEALDRLLDEKLRQPT